MSDRWRVVTFELRVLLDEDPDEVVLAGLQRRLGEWLERLPQAEASLLICDAPAHRHAPVRKHLLLTGHTPCNVGNMEPGVQRFSQELVEIVGQSGVLRYGDWARTVVAHHCRKTG